MCSVRYHQLERLQNDIVQLNKENKALESDLKAFHDLPLDQDLARVHVEQLRRKLHALEAEFNDAISKMA